MKYKCACCSYYTLENKPNHTSEICPVCFWAEDCFQFKNPDLTEGSNKVSLKIARENFKNFGAAEKNFIQYSREPNFTERIGIEEYGERYS